MFQEVDPQAVSMLLEFMYSSEILINDETVQILLPTANLLQIEEVRNACCEYLQSQLHPTNCLGFRDFADVHSCKELHATAHNYAEQHFGDVIHCDEFLALSAEHLSDLVASDNLSVSSEEEVFEVSSNALFSSESSIFCPVEREKVEKRPLKNGATGSYQFPVRFSELQIFLPIVFLNSSTPCRQSKKIQFRNSSVIYFYFIDNP